MFTGAGKWALCTGTGKHLGSAFFLVGTIKISVQLKKYIRAMPMLLIFLSYFIFTESSTLF